MMYRPIILSIVLAALLWGCGVGGDSAEQRVADARGRNDGPAIWQVSDPDSTLYLFGSVHLLPKDFDWQKRDLQASFDAVGTVFFETPDDMQADLQVSIAQRIYGLYDTGQRLQDHLNTRQLNRLTAAAHNVDIPVETLNGFKPWLASDLLLMAAAQKAGLSAEYSPDTVLRSQAKTAQKNIRALDEPQTYIKAVATLPQRVQMKAFEDTLKNIDDYATETQTLKRAWVRGQVEWIEQETIAPMAEKYPQIYEALFTRRNANWTKILDNFLHGDSDALVVVGIGHMLGDDGLPNRLRELGYDVKRVQRFDLPND